MTFVIAAAGTGGHVYPALAVARRLVALGIAPASIRFFGGDRIEAEAVPEAGFAFSRFSLARLERSPTPRNLSIPSVVRRSSRAMAEELSSSGARAVLGMGGYVVVPAALAARRTGIPFFLQEQNAAPGVASRFAARRSRRVFVGLPGPSERLRNAVLSGNPLREPLEAFERAALAPQAAEHYGLEGRRPVVGVLGGSLGARVLNEAAGHLAERLGAGTVLHVTGRSEEAQVARGTPPEGVQWVHVPYEPSMEMFYAAVDLVVCRAGAMTVSELAATRTPAVLVPLDRAGQRANAAAAAAAGAALVVGRGDIGRLPDIVAAVAGDDDRMAVMAEAAGAFARTGAATTIAEALLDAAEAPDA